MGFAGPSNFEQIDYRDARKAIVLTFTIIPLTILFVLFVSVKDSYPNISLLWKLLLLITLLLGIMGSIYCTIFTLEFNKFSLKNGPLMISLSFMSLLFSFFPTFIF